MKETEAKNRGGRPQKFPGEGPRITHATRLRPATAARLAEEADRSHRSLGEEIEFRINTSFDALVVDIDKETREKLNNRAGELNQSVEEHIRHIIATFRVIESLAVEGLPAVRDLMLAMETFRAAQIGLVLMEVMDNNSSEIGNFLRQQVMCSDKCLPDAERQKKASDIVKSGIEAVSSTFEEKFGIGSLDKVAALIDDMLSAYVKKHSGHLINKDEVADKTRSSAKRKTAPAL